MNDSKEFPQPQMIQVAQGELEVFVAGQQNVGRPLILCHGWPELAYSWRYQIPALVEAGYHVIVPNQRGFGNSLRPETVEEYDIEHLTGDLLSLLEHFGYQKATFIGHDWGAMVVWWMSLLHPQKVERLITLSIPYQVRGEMPWIEMIRNYFGPNHYFVHFNEQPGVADAVFEQNIHQFLENLYRKRLPQEPPGSGMVLMELAHSNQPKGEPLLSEEDFGIFVSSFESSGFTPSINWYRNLDRNWHLLADIDPIVSQPGLMIYGDQDTIPRLDNLADFAPMVEVTSLNAGHWIQQESPDETNEIILQWLRKTEKN